MGDRRRGIGNARGRRLRGVEPAVRDAGRPRREREGVRAAREVAGRRRGGGTARERTLSSARRAQTQTDPARIDHMGRRTHHSVQCWFGTAWQAGARGTTSRAEPPPVAKSHDVRAPPRDFSRPVAVARAPASFATPPRGFPARAPLRERSARAILGQSGRDAVCANDHPPGVRSPRSRPRPPGRRPARAPRVRARAGTLARRRTPRRPPRGPRRSRRKYLLPPMRLGRATPRSPWSARRSRRDRSPAPASPSPRVPARRTTRKEPPSRRTRPPHR